MRVVLMHPNHHSGGAEIAGNWPRAWVADLVGCLKAFAKSGFERTFYDLGKVGYWGPQAKKKVDFAFDTSTPSRPKPLRRLPTRCGRPCTTAGRVAARCGKVPR
jgi:hypothetical protein